MGETFDRVVKERFPNRTRAPPERQSGWRRAACHGRGAARTTVVESGGKPCSVVVPDGHRTLIFLGGFPSGYPKKHADVDWL